MGEENFYQKLKNKMDGFVHFIYKITKNFPKEELYGIISQIRRAALSIILNYIEGFARCRAEVRLNFWEISYGSLKESQYLLDFSYREKFINSENYQKAISLADEIGAMLWRALKSINKQK